MGEMRVISNPLVRMISVSENHVFILRNNCTIESYQNSPSHFITIDYNSGTQKIVATGNDLYVLHRNGMLWKYQGAPYQFIKIDENSASVDIVAASGNLYVLHNNGMLWKYQGAPYQFQRIDYNGNTIKIVASENDLYVLHRNGALWKYQGAPNQFEKIDENPATVDIVAASGNCYVLHNNGMLWKYLGAPNQFQRIDYNGNTKKIVATENDLYVLHRNGALWKYQGAPNQFEKIDENPATVDIVAASGNLYVVHNNGDLWSFNNQSRQFLKIAGTESFPEDVIYKYAPILSFHPNEGGQCCFPSDAGVAYDLITRGSFGEMRTPKSLDSNAPCYYQYAGLRENGQDIVRIKYWFWYNFNDFPNGPDPYGSHEGDWEYVEVILVGMKLQCYYLSNHDGSRLLMPKTGTYEGSHLIVWIGNGSHACYGSPYDSPYSMMGFSDEIQDGGAKWRTYNNLVNFFDTRFANYTGRWGNHNIGAPFVDFEPPIGPASREFESDNTAFPIII